MDTLEAKVTTYLKRNKVSSYDHIATFTHGQEPALDDVLTHMSTEGLVRFGPGSTMNERVIVATDKLFYKST